MHTLYSFFNLIFHLEEHLRAFMGEYGAWIYILLFLIIFCETGLVITPFLPGDSLLFALGALAAVGMLDIFWLLGLLSAAAIGGDALNYALGKWAGPRVFRQKQGLLFRRDYLEKTEAFYKKYGSKTIILARFVPIIRTFAPFVAGIGKMQYKRFFSYNVIGGLLWVSAFLGAGYVLGNIPVVQRNFKLLVLLIILGSLMPIAWEWHKHRRQARKKTQE